MAHSQKAHDTLMGGKSTFTAAYFCLNLTRIYFKIKDLKDSC